MMAMEETNNSFLNAGVFSSRASIHWMGSSISTSKTSVFPPEDTFAKIDEAGISGDEIDKSAEKVLNLELLSYGNHDIWQEEGSKNGEVHEVPNFRKDQSPKRMSLESVVQQENVQNLVGLARFKCILDLNEPAKIEEHSHYELNPFLSPSKTEPEAQEPPISTKNQAENGIDLNMSPLSSEEEVTMI